MPKQIWQRAERAYLSDAAGLLSLGGIALLRGFSYLPMNINAGRSPAHWLESQFAPPVWAGFWISIGILCIISIWATNLVPLAVALGVGIHALWLFSFIGIQMTGENQRAYVSALGYYGVSFFAAWGFGRGRKPKMHT